METLAVLLAANFVLSIFLAYLIVKNKAMMFGEIKELWESQLNIKKTINKIIEAKDDDISIMLKIAKKVNRLDDNQTVFHEDIKRICLELRQVKFELARTQVFLMDRVENLE